MQSAVEIKAILERLSSCTVTVFGDFCVDVYWVLENEHLECSVETGLPSQRVIEQRYSLGGAGNVVANLRALGTGSVRAVGVAGCDPFGAKLLSLLEERDVNCQGMSVRNEWQTMVYAKPMRKGVEMNRLDFGAFNRMGDEARDRLVEALRKAAVASDVVVLNQQVPGGVTDTQMMQGINRIIAEFPHTLFIVDARHHQRGYNGALLKLNSEEAARYLGEKEVHSLSRATAAEYALRIHERTARPVFITRGAHGIIVASEGTTTIVPGLRIRGPIDAVGAGDSVVAALAAALGSGETAHTAAEIANVVASITVQKLNTTGTATPREVKDAMGSLDYADHDAE